MDRISNKSKAELNSEEKILYIKSVLGGWLYGYIETNEDDNFDWEMRFIDNLIEWCTELIEDGVFSEYSDFGDFTDWLCIKEANREGFWDGHDGVEDICPDSGINQEYERRCDKAEEEICDELDNYPFFVEKVEELFSSIIEAIFKNENT